MATICLATVPAATSASPTPADPIPTGKVINSVICKADPSQSYALYIPTIGNGKPLPVVYFFDPHGIGAIPLKKYKQLAETYGYILIGSNNSKNGNDWATTGNIWSHLSEDTHARLKINNNRMYMAGFSGGAKVAGYMAIQHPEMKGIIANGAGLPDGVQGGNFNFSFTALAGEGDMNMTDLIAFNRDLDNTKTRHRMLIFDGKHEWAPESTMEEAFSGWELEGMQMGFIPHDKNLIDRCIAKSKVRVDAYIRTNQLIRAMEEYRFSINCFEGLSEEAGGLRKKVVALEADPIYQSQREAQQGLFDREQNTKAEFMQHFQSGGGRYWSGVINDLNRRVKNTQGEEKGMDQRLLAYLSLAFYSISNQLITARQDDQARRFTDLYKMADPANSEAWYFSAILNARSDQTAAAESDLLRAVGCGFHDKERLRQQPEFKNAASRIDLNKVETAMH